MIIKKMSFVFIVFAFSIMGAVISSVSAGIASEKATKEADRIARRDNMIAELKAQYASKLAATKTEVTKIVVENKVEATEIAAEKIAEAGSIVTEKISDVKDAVESASEHGAEEAKSDTD
jgi:F0F1-type ATP synthase membrane subunit b/b'